MKRILSFILCMLLLGSLCACSSPRQEDTTPTANSPTTLKSLKILAIGNSFSVDAMEHLYTVAKAEGVEEIVLGNLYVGGCTLKMHVDYAQTDAPEYRFYKNTTGTWEQTEGYTLLQGLQDEDWDMITMQQGSAGSGLVDTYDPYLDDLITYVNNNKTNPDAKLLWHMTWAYQGNSTHKAFPTYGNSQQTMYYGIVNALQKVIDVKDAITMTIPVGTAVQNARTSFIGDTLTRDGHHLNDLGRVIASYTWYAALDGQPLYVINLDKVTDTLTLTEEQKAVIVESVNAAIATPQAVTNSVNK